MNKSILILLFLFVQTKADGLAIIRENCSNETPNINMLIRCMGTIIHNTSLSKIYIIQKEPECSHLEDKVIKLQRIKSEELTIDNVANEISIGHEVNNQPFLFGLEPESCFYKKNNKNNQNSIYYIFLVLKKKKGDLNSFIKKTDNFKHNILWKLLLISQLFKGLKSLHEKGILHLDLKFGNVLMENNYEIKISDFGLSVKGEKCELKDGCRFKYTTNKRRGTPSYYSIDHVYLDQNHLFSDKTDVYVLARMIIMMFSNDYSNHLIRNFDQSHQYRFEWLIAAIRNQQALFIKNDNDTVVDTFSELLSRMSWPTIINRLNIDDAYVEFLSGCESILNKIDKNINGIKSKLNKYSSADIDGFLSSLLSEQISYYTGKNGKFDMFIIENQDYLSLLWEKAKTKTKKKFKNVDIILTAYMKTLKAQDNIHKREII